MAWLTFRAPPLPQSHIRIFGRRCWGSTPASVARGPQRHFNEIGVDRAQDRVIPVERTRYREPAHLVMPFSGDLPDFDRRSPRWQGG